MTALLASWQSRLSLFTWQITVEESEDLGDDKACTYYHREACPHCNCEGKTARVQIERGIAYPEKRIVHELVHLVLSPLIPIDQTEEQKAAEEAVVQALVAALLPSPGLREA